MAAKDFPASPVAGQVFENWVWNATNESWDSLYNGTPPAMLQVSKYADASARTTAIPTPAEGMITYLDNINQFQGYAGSSWRPFGGLVPITPTSVAISGGTATQNDIGTIAFSAGTTAITLNGVFTSAFKSYKIVIEGVKNAVAGNDALQARLSSGGTPVSTSTYTQAAAAFAMSSAATQNLGGTPATAFYVSRIYQASSKYSAEISVYSPALAVQTTWNGLAYGTTLGDEQSIVVGGTHITAASYDGLHIFATGNAVSGNITIYGINQ